MRTLESTSFSAVIYYETKIHQFLSTKTFFLNIVG